MISWGYNLWDMVVYGISLDYHSSSSSGNCLKTLAFTRIVPLSLNTMGDTVWPTNAPPEANLLSAISPRTSDISSSSHLSPGLNQHMLNLEGCCWQSIARFAALCIIPRSLLPVLGLASTMGASALSISSPMSSKHRSRYERKLVLDKIIRVVCMRQWVRSSLLAALYGTSVSLGSFPQCYRLLYMNPV